MTACEAVTASYLVQGKFLEAGIQAASAITGGLAGKAVMAARQLAKVNKVVNSPAGVYTRKNLRTYNQHTRWLGYTADLAAGNAFGVTIRPTPVSKPIAPNGKIGMFYVLAS